VPESKHRKKQRQKRPGKGRKPTGLSVRARFGDRDLKAFLMKEVDDLRAGKSVEVSISEDELHRNPPDLSAAFRLYDATVPVGDDPDKARYGGYVKEIEQGQRGWWTMRSNNLAHLADHITGGIVVRNVPVPEIFWSTMRGAGMPPDKLRVHDWTPPPPEPILVVVPVAGLAPIGTLAAGSIHITTDRSVLEPFESLEHAQLKPQFVDAELWAVMTIIARTLFDAEQQAVRFFERVVGRLALAARYSSAELPNGELRGFQRKQLLERIRLVHIAGVRGMRTGRLWLRGYAHARAVEPTEAAILTGVAEYIGASDQRVDDAIVAWRRATAEEDPAVSVVALGEAIEFYAATTKVPKLFTKAELGQLQKLIPNELAEDKAARVALMIDRLNEPPLSARLRTALDNDRVRYSGAEFDLLVEIRGLRNKILHGKERELPSEEQLNQALGLVNRMLLFRLKRLREVSAATSSE
jgi:hypothetical protein